MHRFISSAASSSCARADRPAATSSSCNSAEQPAISLDSAEQPATPSHLHILSIRDAQRWLAEPSVASCSSADMQRIREAVAVLSNPKPRVKLLKREVLQMFQRKVIQAAKRLKVELSHSAEQPALASPVVHDEPDIPGAEQSDTSMVVAGHPAILMDYKLARQTENNLGKARKTAKFSD